MEDLPDILFMERMKELIRGVGSAEKLARLTGMSARVIGQYASGKSDPTRRKLIALAEAGGVLVEWLATGKGPKGLNDVSCVCEPSKIPYDVSLVNIKDAPRETMVQWLREFWTEADEDTRVWFKMEFKRRFPEYGEWLEKKLRDESGFGGGSALAG